MGITPACAGKTTAARRSALPRRDHPRMRGEDSQVPVGRGRGVGITPACAGKTNHESIRTHLGPDHPRMRGEDFFAEESIVPHAGSPPHARGRRKTATYRQKMLRITPACAGKTLPSWSHSGPSGDHPRMRGEDRLGSPIWEGSRGSPPHARGRREGCVRDRFSVRITPACAGKTRRPSDLGVGATDHPRMRGEDYGGGFVTSLARGSPPHARGRQEAGYG